jgi:hypothetical protein
MHVTDEVAATIAEARHTIETSISADEFASALQLVAGALQRYANEHRDRMPKDVAADLAQRVTALEAWSPEDQGFDPNAWDYSHNQFFAWLGSVRGAALATLDDAVYSL